MFCTIHSIPFCVKIYQWLSNYAWSARKTPPAQPLHYPWRHNYWAILLHWQRKYKQTDEVLLLWIFYALKYFSVKKIATFRRYFWHKELHRYFYVPFPIENFFCIMVLYVKGNAGILGEPSRRRYTIILKSTYVSLNNQSHSQHR